MSLNNLGVKGSGFSKEELQVLKREFESMKAVLQTFKKDDELKAKEIAKLRQEISRILNAHTEETEKLNKSFEVRTRDLHEQINTMNKKIQSTKKE